MSLPSGAIRLNWIQSTGTQYVDTGITINATTYNKYRFLFDIGYPSIGGSYWMVNGNSGSNVIYYFGLSNTGVIVYGNGTKDVSGSVSASAGRYLVDFNPSAGSYRFGDLQNLTGLTFNAPGGSQNFYLFAYNKGGSQDMHTERLYSAKIYNAGTLVRDYIPCKLSDGSVGLWDDVEGKFYGNAGTGAFVAGPAAEIVELEYIESTGTQYVDTNVFPNQNTRLILDVAYLGSAGSNVAGVRNSTTDTTNRFGIITFGSASKIGAFFRGSSIQAVPFDNERHLFDLSKGGLSADGASFGGSTSGTFACTYPFVLFGWSEGPAGVVKTASRVYGCQLFESGLLLRDYVPAKTIEGEVGLYDRVFKEFYRNAGTGEFIAGPEMAHEGYTELEYVESDGTQYVDAGVKPAPETRCVADVQFLTFPSSHSALFGCYDSSNQWWAYYRYDERQYRAVNGGKTQNSIAYADPTVRTTVELKKGLFRVGDTELTLTENTFTLSYSIFIFALSNSGESQFPGAFKMYSCQISDNGAEARIYIPMLHPSGVAGLWDAVNERFYASASTTDLIAGPEAIKVPKTPENFRVVSETDTEVALAWDASENAAGYRLYKDGGLLANTMDLTFTDTAEPFGAYTYTVRAYNEYGEGEAAELVVFLSPDNPILWLVTDRTQGDVTARNSKGIYRAQDLNRVGAAVEYLRRRLLSAGVLAEVSPRMNWMATEWVTPATAAAYLENVRAMREALSLPKNTPAAPDDLEKFTYTEANHIEIILVELDRILTHMMQTVDAGWATCTAYTGFYAKEAN